MAMSVVRTSRLIPSVLANSVKVCRLSSVCFNGWKKQDVTNNERLHLHKNTFMFVRSIQSQETPNPNSIKLLPGKVLLPDGTVDFPNSSAAAKSPLAKKLFEINGISGVYFGHDFLTVTKNDEDLGWHMLKPQIIAVVEGFLSSGQPVLDDDVTFSESESNGAKEDETVALIKELIETRIRPTVQDDGGDIVFKGFEEGVVKVKLQGSCTGCPSSSVTLKRGVQNMLQFYVPEVMGVIEVEDEVDDISKQEFEKFEKSMDEMKSRKP